MTRINVGVHPQELPSKLLIAEHREIKRIPNVVASGRYSMEGQPKQFTLGTGHVKFFYDKLLYLRKRYIALNEECYARGFNVQDYRSAWNGVPSKMMGDYSPSEVDRSLIVDRIRQRGFELCPRVTKPAREFIYNDASRNDTDSMQH
jgi:deoxyribonuclease (pyrimidine dimer)